MRSCLLSDHQYENGKERGVFFKFSDLVVDKYVEAEGQSEIFI